MNFNRRELFGPGTGALAGIFGSHFSAKPLLASPKANQKRDWNGAEWRLVCLQEKQGFHRPISVSGIY